MTSLGSVVSCQTETILNKSCDLCYLNVFNVSFSWTTFLGNTSVISSPPLSLLLSSLAAWSRSSSIGLRLAVCLLHLSVGGPTTGLCVACAALPHLCVTKLEQALTQHSVFKYNNKTEIKTRPTVFTRTWLRYVRVFAIANPSVVCRLSVTLVHPTQGVEAFGNISSPLCTLAILWPPCKILRR